MTSRGLSASSLYVPSNQKGHQDMTSHGPSRCVNDGVDSWRAEGWAGLRTYAGLAAWEANTSPEGKSAPSLWQRRWKASDVAKAMYVDQAAWGTNTSPKGKQRQHYHGNKLEHIRRNQGNGASAIPEVGKAHSRPGRWKYPKTTAAWGGANSPSADIRSRSLSPTQ